MTLLIERPDRESKSLDEHLDDDVFHTGDMGLIK